MFENDLTLALEMLKNATFTRQQRFLCTELPCRMCGVVQNCCLKKTNVLLYQHGDSKNCILPLCYKCEQHGLLLKKDHRTDRSFITYKSILRMRKYDNTIDDKPVMPEWETKRIQRKKNSSLKDDNNYNMSRTYNE